MMSYFDILEKYDSSAVSSTKFFCKKNSIFLHSKKLPCGTAGEFAL
jgi:hypothetical protein